jgi:hypothetical protein
MPFLSSVIVIKFVLETTISLYVRVLCYDGPFQFCAYLSQYYHVVRGTLYPHKLALTSPTSDSRSVAIVRSRIQATEFKVREIFRLRNINIVRFLLLFNCYICCQYSKFYKIYLPEDGRMTETCSN